MADIADNTSTTSIITGTGSFTGVLELNEDSDWWRVSLTGGQTYMFLLTGDGGATSLDDATMYLRNSLGSSVEYVSDGRTLSFTPDSDGTFYIDVKDADIYDGVGEGNYVLTSWMSDTIKNNNATTAAITGSGQTLGVLGENTDSDWYRINLVAGRSYSWELVGDGSVNTLDDARLILRDANGNQIKYMNDGQYMHFTPTTSGSYYLDVKDSDIYDGLAEGNYVITSYASDTVLASTATTAVIQNGTDVRSRIDAAQDADWYRLNAATGATYEIRLSGIGTDPFSDNRVYLTDSLGNTISYDDGSVNGAAVLSFKAASAGPFYLVVRSGSSYDDLKGGYQLSLRSDLRWITGTAAQDTLSGMDNDNIINGVSGNDVLNGNGGNDRLIGGWGNDVLSGGAGHDIGLFSGNVAITASLALTGWQNTGHGMDRLIGIEGLIGGNLNDVLTGNGANNTLDGSAGNDRLDGAGGHDTLIGGLGNDTINGGAGADTLTFAPGGARTVNLSLTTAQATGEGNDQIIGIEHVIGTNFNDRITGSAGNNRLDGAGGHDLLAGGLGNDQLLGGLGNDTIDGGLGVDQLIFLTNASTTVDLARTTAYATGQGTDRILNVENVLGGAGHDRFFGSTAANVLEGAAGNDLLDGRAGNDRLVGGGGMDTLRGGAGNDVLTGGNEADVFFFEAGGGVDRITDFRNGTDLIEFRSGANSLADLTVAQVGGDAHISYAGNKIVLAGTSIYQLDASDFVFS